eukprot:1160625-Pelagomonas_calceolata.AAC.9
MLGCSPCAPIAPGPAHTDSTTAAAAQLLLRKWHSSHSAGLHSPLTLFAPLWVCACGQQKCALGTWNAQI